MQVWLLCSKQHLLVLLSDDCGNHRVLHSGQRLVNRERRGELGLGCVGGV